MFIFKNTNFDIFDPYLGNQFEYIHIHFSIGHGYFCYTYSFSHIQISDNVVISHFHPCILKLVLPLFLNTPSIHECMTRLFFFKICIMCLIQKLYSSMQNTIHAQTDFNRKTNNNKINDNL